MLRPSLIFAGAAAAVSAAGGEFGQHAHEHGKVTFNIAQEGQTLAIELDAPADGVVGFEHAPRTDAEKAAVARIATLLKTGAGLFEFPPGAACSFVATELHAPEWEEGHDHADYEAKFTFRCTQPRRLEWLRIPLLASLHEVHEAEVNVVTARAQHQMTIKSADARVRLQ